METHKDTRSLLDPDIMAYDYKTGQAYFQRYKPIKRRSTEIFMTGTLYALPITAIISIIIVKILVPDHYWDPAVDYGSNILMATIIITTLTMAALLKDNAQKMWQKIWFLHPLSIKVRQKKTFRKAKNGHIRFFASQMILFKYKATGDFAKYLETITWQCIEPNLRSTRKTILKIGKLKLKLDEPKRVKGLNGYKNSRRRYDIWFTQEPKKGKFEVNIY